MKRGHKCALVVLISCLCLSSQATDITPFQFSVLAPGQLFGSNKSVAGLRLGVIYARNKSLYGFDIGTGINSLKEDLYGFQIAMVGNTAKSANGFQIGILGNKTEQLRGAQVGLFNMANDAAAIQIGMNAKVNGNMIGIQISCSPFFWVPALSGNRVQDRMHGIQIGLASRATEMYGMQDGLLVNMATICRGTQIGLVNLTRDMKGIQLGGVNIFMPPNLKHPTPSTGTSVTGIQIGAFNIGGKVRGLQIGLYNSAMDMKGVQIGAA
ncbi:MAG: hypothetical protein JXN60_04515, partial [Lentisphaerae bacterium]|nr:hypothetical protein [Lentisphaerota bacterium]